MKESWGLSLDSDFCKEEDKLLLTVKDIQVGSPASKLMEVGDRILTINSWEIEKMREAKVAENIFRAAGHLVQLRIDK